MAESSIRRAFTDLMPASHVADGIQDITASFTTTAVNTEFVEIDTSNAAGLQFYVTASATAAGVFTVEGTMDDSAVLENVTAPTGWFNLPYRRFDSAASGNGALAALVANTSHAYLIDTSVAMRTRIRISTALGALPRVVKYQKLHRLETFGAQALGGATQSISGTITFPTGTDFNYTTTATLNRSTMKTSAGSLYELTIRNASSAALTFRLYNKASAPVTTDVPRIVYTVAAGDQLVANYGSIGNRFGTGIAYAVTGGTADNDATNTTAGAVISATYV